jgi:hypothetical protein
MEKLEKVDIVRERTETTYEKAKMALENNEWDVVEAIIDLEKQKKVESKIFNVKGKDVINKVKELIKQGNVAKIVVKKEGQKVVSIPVNGGIILAVFFPYFVALSAVVVLVAEYELVVEKFKEDSLNEENKEGEEQQKE